MIRLITDSAADFEPYELEKLNITCIPLTVMFDDAEYQENISLSKDGFYDLLLNSGHQPKTAQASPTILMDLFEDARDSGDDAIYITISSAISGTYQTALMSKNLVDCDRCHVVDSLNATGGQRILLEYAARLRDEGCTAEDIVSKAEALRGRVALFACIDTLEYLYRGGRISQTVYKLGNLANIKPIITVDPDGGIGVPAKAMGMRKGMDILCKKPELQKPDAGFPIYCMYTNNRSVAEALAARLAACGYEIPDEHIIQVGAAIGSHIGPDACGLVYVSEA